MPPSPLVARADTTFTSPTVTSTLTTWARPSRATCTDYPHGPVGSSVSGLASWKGTIYFGDYNHGAGNIWKLTDLVNNTQATLTRVSDARVAQLKPHPWGLLYVDVKFGTVGVVPGTEA
jgi:hypothetical protein